VTPAQGSAAAAQQRLRERLLRDVPSVAAETVDALLTEARADRARTARQIDVYLLANPHGLVAPDPLCPLGIVRLTQVLASHGHPVIPPACHRCGRRVHLPRQEPGGRICESCHRLAQAPSSCTRCARPGRPHARFGEELLCRNCYRKDPRSHRECGKCGRIRPIDQRAEDGSLLCPTCAPRPMHICVDCGRERPAQTVTAAGPVCAGCYPKHQTRRPCGQCGTIAVIAVRAVGETPDLCHNCWYPHSKRAVERRSTSREQPAPTGRRPEPRPKQPRLATCSLCDRTRTVTVTWPIGPVCGSCYLTTQEHPRVCHLCSAIRVLIAKDPHEQPICGPCGGSRFDYRCGKCGIAGRVYAAGNCYRCCVEIRLAALLGGGQGPIPSHLAPLADALLAVKKPRSVLVWLERSPAARLLAQLVDRAEPLTHASLDSLPPSRAVHFVRRMLMDTGVLPDRLDHLDRIVPWLDALLKTQPAAHARLVRPYAQWHLLHRARRRAQRRGDSSAAANGLRETIRVTLQLLDWLDAHSTDLANLTQHHVDRWLAEPIGPHRRHTARDFLRWAVTKRLAPKGVSIPPRKIGQPTTFVDSKDYIRQLRRCLHDPALPTDLRAAGALILLYGFRTTQVLALRRDQLVEREADYLQLGENTLLLPPTLASLLRQLPLRRSNNRTVLPAANSLAPLLFPGFSDALPPDAGTFGARLLRHGITPRAGRNTAMVTLAGDLPAAVLADLIGIHDVTATRWAQRTKSDWHSYLAQRRTDTADLATGSVGQSRS
jgi:hypothetical protein